jgi:ATP-dependent RNA helicase RhlE
MSFQHLQLIEPVSKALADEGYTQPTPVQEQAIPVILQHKDVLGCAQTGTGKTAAFAIPILQLLHAGNIAPTDRRRTIKALVLAPTRELAIQVGESFQAYGKHLPLKHLVIFGGVPQNAQVSSLSRGTDILVATPGRLLDLLHQRHLSLQHVEHFVLDEADRMLDMGFIHDVKRIIAKLPLQRQTLFFSATISPAIKALSSTLLKQPVFVTATPPASQSNLISQSIYYVDKQNKTPLLVHLLADQNIKTALVFARTKHGADKIARQLNKAGIRCASIHGNKSQNARQSTLLNFKTGRIRVLIATDIAARGLDIDGMSHVFNYDLPNIPETYVHRIGRTGRAGASGEAISFCDFSEKIFLRDIQNLVAKEIAVIRGHVFDNPLMYQSPQQVPREQPAPRSHSKKRGRVFFQQRA